MERPLICNSCTGQMVERIARTPNGQAIVIMVCESCCRDVYGIERKVVSK